MNIANIFADRPWFQVLQTSERSQTAVMTLEPGGNSSEGINVHAKSDQILLVVEGDVDAEVGPEKKRLKAGDVCLVPAGTAHRFANAGTNRCVTFNVYSPPE
jgi:mannose-6-phosphate isomerase-like protein (cupin superfamily)